MQTICLLEKNCKFAALNNKVKNKKLFGLYTFSEKEKPQKEE